MASYNSTAMTSAIKVKYCVKWQIGINTLEGFKYKDTITALRYISKTLIRSSRPNDPNLEFVLLKI